MVTEDVCGQRIRPGGQSDINFFRNVVLPYYISENWLGIAPPAGQNPLNRDIYVLSLTILVVQASNKI